MFNSDGLNFDDLREFKWEFAREAEKHFITKDPDFFVNMSAVSHFLRENGQRSLYSALDLDLEAQAEDLFYDKTLAGEMEDRLDDVFKHYTDKIDDVLLSMSYIKEQEAQAEAAEGNFMEGFERAAETETGKKVFETVVGKAKESKEAPEGFWRQFASLSGKDQLKVVGKTLWGMFKVLVGASGVGGTSYNAENSLRDILQILQKQNEHTAKLMDGMIAVMKDLQTKQAVDSHKQESAAENEGRGNTEGSTDKARTEEVEGNGDGRDFIKRGKVPFDFEAAGISADLLKVDRPWMHGWAKNDNYAKEFDDFCLMQANILADCISCGATQEGFHRLKDGEAGKMYDATVDYLYESMHEKGNEGVDLINNNKQIAAVELYNFCCKNTVDSAYATALSDRDTFKTAVDEIAARMDKDVYCSFEEAANVTFPNFGFEVPDKKQYFDYETSDNAAIYQHFGSQYIEGLKSQIDDMVNSPDYPDGLAPEKKKELDNLQVSALFADRAVTYLCDYGANFGGFAMSEADFAGKDAFGKLIAELKAEYDKPEYEGGPLACVHGVLLKREQDNLDRFNDISHIKDIVTHKPQFEKTKEEEKEMKNGAATSDQTEISNLVGIIEKFKDAGVSLGDNGQVQLDPSKFSRAQLRQVTQYYDHECHIEDVVNTFYDMAIHEDGLFDEKTKMSVYDNAVSITADEFLDEMNPDSLAYDYESDAEWDVAGFDVMRNIVSDAIEETKDKVAGMEKYKAKGLGKDEGNER